MAEYKTTVALEIGAQSVTMGVFTPAGKGYALSRYARRDILLDPVEEGMRMDYVSHAIGEMVAEIFSWGFVRMPGLIFTLDLDGIIWLLTVKLLFWLLGILLALLCGVLAVALGSVVSFVVYPFALYKAYCGKMED